MLPPTHADFFLLRLLSPPTHADFFLLRLLSDEQTFWKRSQLKAMDCPALRAVAASVAKKEDGDTKPIEAKLVLSYNIFFPVLKPYVVVMLCVLSTA